MSVATIMVFSFMSVSQPRIDGAVTRQMGRSNKAGERAWIYCPFVADVTHVQIASVGIDASAARCPRPKFNKALWECNGRNMKMTLRVHTDDYHCGGFGHWGVLYSLWPKRRRRFGLSRAGAVPYAGSLTLLRSLE